MNDESKSIHEFDLQLICNYFSTLERQGPGSPEQTLKALRFIDNLTRKSRILDIGCGTGAPTMVLAEHTQAKITGLDLFPNFIDRFNQNARQRNLQARVKGLVGSMEALPFSEETFDLIWSEGAIYNIGFERGINEWRKYLKTGGYLAVTEACWFTEQRPDEIHDFWTDAYPEINTIPCKLDQLQKAGYVPVATFILPENCWMEHFYELQPKIQEAFLKEHSGNRAAEEFIACERHEADLYRKYKAFYGYVFFIGKKI